jgi:hypothetical protein
MIIVKWFKNKAMEIEMKYALYSAIKEFAKEQENIIKFVKNLYVALKDVPIDDLRKELIKEIASLAHEQAVKERESEKTA